MRSCDILIPTFERPGGLALTLAGLAGQVGAAIDRVIVADQSRLDVSADLHVAAMCRVLRHQGLEVQFHRRTRRRGVAEQRAFLLEQALADVVLYLDDDVWLAPWALRVLQEALESLGCGLVGMAVTGLSYDKDRRPTQLRPFSRWEGPVVPEDIRPGSEQWARHSLHNAANPTHLTELTAATPESWVAYKVAWIGGCVLCQRAALREAGGFDFWRTLPAAHAGEDVLAQSRVMRMRGGAGILPAGAVHLELPTTIPNRQVEAWRQA